MNENVRRVLQIGLAHKRYTILLIVLGAISTLLSAMVPFYLRNLLANLEDLTVGEILRYIGIIVLLYTASMAVYLYSGFVSNFAETKAAAWLKRKLFISTLLAENLDTGDALSRIQSDTEIVGRMGMSLIPAVITEAFSLIISVIVVFRLNFYLGVITLLTLPIYGFSLRAFVHASKQLRPRRESATQRRLGTSRRASTAGLMRSPSTPLSTSWTGFQRSSTSGSRHQRE